MVKVRKGSTRCWGFWRVTLMWSLLLYIYQLSFMHSKRKWFYIWAYNAPEEKMFSQMYINVSERLLWYKHIMHRTWAGYLSRYSDWLRAGRSGDRIPVGRDFPPVQTGPGAHPASCTMGTGSFPVVKCGRGVLLTTHPLLVPRSWKSRATCIPLPTLWATTGPVTGTLYLYLNMPPTFFGHSCVHPQEDALKRIHYKTFWTNAHVKATKLRNM